LADIKAGRVVPEPETGRNLLLGQVGNRIRGCFVDEEGHGDEKERLKYVSALFWIIPEGNVRFIHPARAARIPGIHRTH
jgi:hypothetical protein